MFSVKSDSSRVVEPAISRNAIRQKNSTMLVLDSHFMPLARPESTEISASSVMPTIRATWSAVPGLSAQPRKSRPRISGAHRSERGGDTEDGTDQRDDVDGVTGLAFTRSPSSGSSAQRMETGRPLRCTAYPMARPTTT